MIYGYLDKNIKAANMRELLGNKAKQCFSLSDLDNVNQSDCIPKDASMVAVHGVLRNNDKVIKQAMETNIDWMYMDNAGHYFPDMYKRVTINATAPITFREGKRFEHNTKLEKWRGGQGKNILVLPPSPPYMDTFGARDFLNHLAHNVNVYTDKEMIIRGKPAKGRKARPIQEQLDEAYCVITWGSAIALEAMRQGIPTISLGWCPAKLCSFDISDLETDKLLVEPPRMECFDNLTWSSFKREELGQAFDIAIENNSYNPL